MQSIISAKFENFRNADKVLSQIRHKYPNAYIAEETPAADTNGTWQRMFVVPVNSDNSRFVTVADAEEYSDEFSGAFVNIRCDSKASYEIVKMIKRNMGMIISDIDTK